MSTNSWEEPFEGEPGSWPHAGTEIGPFVECDRVPFSPSIEVQPSTRSAESPSGLEVSLVVPQSWEKPETIATSDLKDVKVTLPEGMTANPGLAAGLGACTPEQYARETYSSLPGEGCPPESKIGSIEIETPLLNEKIFGAIYIATPYDNVPSFGDPEHPGGSLLALYVVAKDPAARDHHQSRWEDHPEPRHRTARHDVRRKPPAAVQQVHIEVPSRCDRAADQPPDVWIV